MRDRLPQDDPARLRADILRLKSALHDRTTGLPVYGLLVDRLRTLLDGRRTLGVLHVQVADLELVESLYGWQVFDRILRRVAARLKEMIGKELPSSAFLALNHVAGDRFIAFLPEGPSGSEVDGAFLAGIGREVRARLDEAFDTAEFAGLSPRMRFQVGHAVLSENPYFRFERRVHAAVEEARALPLRMAHSRDLSTGEELKRIIEDSAVRTLFQPVVDLGNRSVLGYEALSRGPKDSMFEMPVPMFAFSGKLGVATDLDRLCRDVALQSCEGLAGKGKIFLNVLPGTLADPEWQNGRVVKLLDASSLCPGDLVLEVSERGADENAEETAAAVERLRASGFGVALDDVGTGYSSLATLERLRPDYIKVDASLVHGVHEHLIQQEALSSLVGIALRLGVAVIAEGVESEEEAAVLRDIGVRYGQGYLFTEPIAPDHGRFPVDYKSLDH